MRPERTNRVEEDASGRRRKSGPALEPSATQLGEALPTDARFLLSLQQTAGNRAISGLVQRRHERSGSDIVAIQRTIDQDARRWATDWLASWTRRFPQAVKRYGLPKLYAICTGVLGEEQPLGPAPPAAQVDRARYTTALAAGLVDLGEKSAGELNARLKDGKPGLDMLMRDLHGRIPEVIPGMKLATPASIAAQQALQLEDPFLRLESGGALFSFSQTMAEHMLRRHHPRYLVGPPLQVQSFFDDSTTIPQIKAMIEGTVNKSKAEIAEWRKFRRRKGTDLGSAAAKTLNLRPFWDGRHWELTLSMDSDNPQESRGTVAHFTPTL